MKINQIKSLVILFVNITFFLNTFAQDITPDWYVQIAGKLNEKAGKVCINNDSSIYFTATFEDSAQVLLNGNQLITTVYSHGFADILLGKLNTDGVLQWIRQIGGTGVDLTPDIEVDNDGNLLLAGTFQDTAYIETDTLICEDFVDAFIAKFDSLGSLIWIQQFAGLKNNQISSISFDSDDNVVIAGFFNGTNTLLNSGQTALLSLGDYDSFITKFDVNGNHIWTKAINSKKAVIIKDLICGQSGNYYFTGSFSDTIIFNDSSLSCVSIGGNDGYIGKISITGDLLWMETFGSQRDDIGKALSFKNKNVIIVAGEFHDQLIINGKNELNSTGSRDIFELAFNKNGNLLWSKAKGQKRNDFIFENHKKNSKFLKVTDYKITDTSYYQNNPFKPRVTLSASDTSGLLSQALVVSEGLYPNIHSAIMTREQETFYCATFSDTLTIPPFTLISKGREDVVILGMINEPDSLKSYADDELNAEIVYQESLYHAHLILSDSNKNSPQVSCYPNPFTSYTNIYYFLPDYFNVIIEITDISGNILHIKEVLNHSPGNHSYKLNDIGLQPGIYPCRITIYNDNRFYTENLKLILLR